MCDDSLRHSMYSGHYLHCLSVLRPSSYIASHSCDLLFIRMGLCSVSLPGPAANTSSLDSRRYSIQCILLIKVVQLHVHI